MVGYRILNPYNLPALHLTSHDSTLRDQVFSLLYAKRKVISERRRHDFAASCPAPLKIVWDGAKSPVFISDTPYPAAPTAA